MGPEKNRELFAMVGEPALGEVDAEFDRRNLAGPTLADLTAEFNRKDNSPRPVTDPTLLAKLYALSMVQGSPMGVSGFNPMEAVDHYGGVTAKAAPHHDTFPQDGREYRTRVIQLLPSGEHLPKDINIFGINLYQPGPNEDALPVEPAKTTTERGLVVIDKRGTVAKAGAPISGQTLLFAVYNTDTRDAKLYQATIERPEAYRESSLSGGAVFENETSATVFLTEGLGVLVRQLGGVEQQQAVLELEAARDLLSDAEPPNSILTPQQQRAAQETVDK